MATPRPEPVLLSWSGGKDSAMALQALADEPDRVDHEVVGLLTTVAQGDRRVSHHGVPEALIAAQAEALGLRLHVVDLPTEGDRMVPNEEYEAILERALRPWLDEGVRTVAHGDLFLEDVRAYRESRLRELGMRALFPIWGRDTTELVHDFLRLGYRAVVSSVDATRLPEELAGRPLDEAFLDELSRRAPGADPSGENGEFHSFVLDGPLFRRPVEVEVGERRRRGDRCYAELRMPSTPRPETRRVVSMLPAATEILGALGLTDRLVGVSHECDHPEEVRDRPRVTEAAIDALSTPGREIDEAVRQRLAEGRSLYAVDQDLLRDLRPDLILTQELCAVCAPTYSDVEELAASLLGRPRVMNLEPSSLEDVLEDVERVARALGEPERGRAVVRELRRRIDEVRRTAGEASERPRVAVLEWLDPPFASGHWTPELVEAAGGTEVLGRAGRPSVGTTWEAVAQARPEVLVVACCGWPLARSREEWEAVRDDPRVRSLAPVEAGRVWVADGSAYFSRPGPRLVDTLELLVAVLHPERSAGTPSESAVVRAREGSGS